MALHIRHTIAAAFAAAVLATLTGCSDDSSRPVPFAAGIASGDSAVPAGNRGPSETAGRTRDNTERDNTESDSAGNSGTRQEFPMNVRVSSIRNFDQTDGQAQWIDSQKRRLMSVQIRFDSDGRFSFDAEDTADGLVPLHGTYRTSGDRISFSGNSSYEMSNGSGRLEISGQIDLDDQLMELNWTATSGMAAHVNDTDFSQAGSTAWVAEAAVVIGR